MQLSPSTVPSDSNALAGIFPVGIAPVATEGPGLAEPAGFAELMAALAPAPVASPAPVCPASSSLAAAAPVATQAQATSLVGGGVAVADMRAPGLVARVVGDVTEVLESVDGDSVSTTEEGSEVALDPSSKGAGSSTEEEQPMKLPRIRETRRSLHEPVAGLETLIVPQIVSTPAPVVEEELDAEPAELDTEEAPLDEDDATGEEAAEDLALPATRDSGSASSPAFTDIETQPEVVRSALHSRRTAALAQAPENDLTSPASTPVADSRGAPTAEAAQHPLVDTRAGQGRVMFPAGDARETASVAGPSASTPGAKVAAATAPAAAREIFAQAQMAGRETTPVLATLRGTTVAMQPTVVDALASAAVATLPVEAASAESHEMPAIAGEEAGELVLSAGTAEGAAPVLSTHREGGLRAVAPRVAAAYAPREKFAAERAAATDERLSQNSEANISFLSTDGESFMGDESAVGIDVAKSTAVMPAPSSPVTFASLAPVAVSVLDVASSPVQEAPEVSVPEAVSNAERAVEVVLRAVDTAADREQKIVKLEFSVGEADLSVHVELAADEVRTTFRTESPELRAALAHEWQAVSADSTEQGGVRLAPAVISDKEHSPSTSADTNSQRQDRQAARQEEATASAHQAAARSLLRSTSQADAPSVATPASRASAPAGTAQRLHLFA